MCHTADRIRLVKVPDQNLFIFCAIKTNESFPELFVESFLSAVANVDGGRARALTTSLFESGLVEE